MQRRVNGRVVKHHIPATAALQSPLGLHTATTTKAPAHKSIHTNHDTSTSCSCSFIAPDHFSNRFRSNAAVSLPPPLLIGC